MIRPLAAGVCLCLLAACATRHPKVVTVAELLQGGASPDEQVLVVGHAGTVTPFLPEKGSSGITFRLIDGTGAIQVVHEGTLRIREGELVQVRGVLRKPPGEPPRLEATRIWILGGRAP